MGRSGPQVHWWTGFGAGGAGAATAVPSKKINKIFWTREKILKIFLEFSGPADRDSTDFSYFKYFVEIKIK